MNAYQALIDWDEDGARLVLSTDEGTQTFKLDDPEQLYDAVKGGIGPWLYEKEQAFQEFKQAVRYGTGPAAEYFACKDPEGDWIRDVALGAMGVGESLEAAAAALDSIDLARKREKGE